MNAGRMRVEIIRFSLLITLTIALISVATRHGGAHHATTQASRSGSPTASASPRTSSGTHAGGGQGAGSNSGGSQAAGNGTGQPAGTAGTAGTQAPSAAPGATSPQSVATLPRTGGTQVAELAGLAALLIAAGGLSLTVSRRSVR